MGHMYMRSAEDVRRFAALDIANCRVVLGYNLSNRLLKTEDYLAPTGKKIQILFMQEHLRSLSYLPLEISQACRDMLDSTGADSGTIFVRVTTREKFDSSVMETHKWPSHKFEQPQAPIKKNAQLLRMVLDQRHDLDTTLLRKEKSKIGPKGNLEYQELLDIMLLSSREERRELRISYEGGSNIFDIIYI
ncbi:hypothetical protein C5167_000830 [Papaver somniferum]|uniref:Uncharacterized protein n=1 Tax=Papaver somniferum TaxID=3469 RepID=A0A4Y7KXM0_PAPSO|nr:hypothetical protein C5167_000830 [Papaver somniferum]